MHTREHGRRSLFPQRWSLSVERAECQWCGVRSYGRLMHIVGYADLGTKIFMEKYKQRAFILLREFGGSSMRECAERGLHRLADEQCAYCYVPEQALAA